MKNFRKNLRKIRLYRGYSQQEMANMLNISSQAYSRYENIEQEPKSGRLKEIAEILGVSMGALLSDGDIDSFIEEDFSKKESNEVLEKDIEKSQLEVIVTARACGPEELEKLIESTLKTQKKYSCNCILNVIPFN